MLGISKNDKIPAKKIEVNGSNNNNSGTDIE
jgi:hypothetical protein